MRLGDAAEAASAKAHDLDWRDAAAYARRARGERKRPHHGWASLTPTEQQVVALVAEGLTNPQIAQRLLMGRSTVKTHLSRIFTKLGVEPGPSSPRKPPGGRGRREQLHSSPPPVAGSICSGVDRLGARPLRVGVGRTGVAFSGVRR